MIGTAGAARAFPGTHPGPRTAQSERDPLRHGGIKRGEAPHDQRALVDFARTDARLLHAPLAQPILMKRSTPPHPRGQPVRRRAGRVREILSVV